MGYNYHQYVMHRYVSLFLKCATIILFERHAHHKITLKKLIRKFAPVETRHKTSSGNKRRLTLESLENRELLTVVGFDSVCDAYEGSSDGYFRLHRDDASDILKVDFEVSNLNGTTANYAGWARNGVDFYYLPGTNSWSNQGYVHFLVGQQFLDINVFVIDDMWREGDETLQLTLLPSANYEIGEGTASITIFDNEPPVGMSFTPYTPETKYINPMEIPEENWKINEVGIRRNGDFDDGNAIPDWWSGTASDNENDLIRLDVSVVSTTDVEYWFRATGATPDVRFWNSSLKGGTPVQTINGGTQITTGITIYAEYISAGSAHVTFELVAIDTITSETLLMETIVFRPFNSITCAFVGEFQTAGQMDANHGINRTVQDLLLDGYDVHVWDDGHDWWSWDQADEWGRGPAYDTIVNAVNHHGQSKIALFGYSHGGGTVYNVAWRIDNNYADTKGNTMTKPYSLVFTSYVDAVTNSGFFNFFEENRRPPGSGFHLGQYQTNQTLMNPGTWANGGPLDDNQEADGSADSSEVEDTEGDGYDVDRTTLGVNHRTIDDDDEVLDLLKLKFIAKVVR